MIVNLPKEVTYRYVVEGPPTCDHPGKPRMQVYDKATGRFIIAFVFDNDELPALIMWLDKVLEKKEVIL